MLLALAFWIWPGSAGAQEPGFDLDVFYATGEDNTKAIAIGDIDGDGDLDIAVGNGDPLFPFMDEFQDQNAIYLNNGLGEFKERIRFGSYLDVTSSMVLGDVDDDGHLDIIIGNYLSPHPRILEYGQSVVYLNDGKGRFTTNEIDCTLGDSYLRGYYCIGTMKTDTRSVAVGDVDGDGALDIVTGNYGGKNFVHLNNGGFTTSVELGAILDTTSVMLGDIDGDGDLDIVVGNDGQQNFIYLNDGDKNGDSQWDRNFTTIALDALPHETASIAVGNIDGDGDLDIVVGNRGEQNFIYLNDGDQNNDMQWDGTFVRIAVGSATDSTKSLALGDINGDGFLDITTGNPGQQNFVYLNNGDQNHDTKWDGAFTPIAVGTVPNNTTSVAFADTDGDGILDIIVGNFGEQNQIYQSDDFGQFLKRIPFSTDVNPTRSVAVGDMNGDGALDILVGNSGNVGYNVIYLNLRNLGRGFETSLVRCDGPTIQCFGTGKVRTNIVAADMNGDDALDIVVGNDDLNVVYLNYKNASGNYGNFDVGPETCDREHILCFGDALALIDSVAVGDMNGDNTLDIVVSKAGQGIIFFNIKDDTGKYGSFATGPIDCGSLYTYCFGHNSPSRTTLAVGDLDGDGDLDIVAGNGQSGLDIGNQNEVYWNDGNGKFTASVTFGLPRRSTNSVAVGDVNGDSLLDIVAGNDLMDSISINDGQSRYASISLGLGTDSTQSVALGDLSGDGALDIIAGNGAGFRVSDSQNVIYLNDGAGNFPTRVHFGSGTDNTQSIALGDINSDGTLDIVTGNQNEQSFVYFNGTNLVSGLVNNPPAVVISNPSPTANANFFATPIILTDRTVSVSYRLIDPEGDPVRFIRACYSLDGGDNWQIAVAEGEPAPTSQNVTQVGNQCPFTTAQNVATAEFDTAPYPGVSHLFKWDTFTSGFFGQSDNVVFRIEAYTSAKPRVNGVPGPYLHPYASATTFPFRVRGIQVRVVSGIIDSLQKRGLSGALVYHLPSGETTGAERMPSPDYPLTTDANGYLQGRGALALGDKLVALWPVSTTNLITFTNSISLFYTSAQPNATGLDMAHLLLLPGPGSTGVQMLTVSPNNKLMLLNLDLSLEWDARTDPEYLEQLTRDLKRASEILFDLTNGQVALGQIRVFQARERWVESHIRIYARNDLRPNANLGGIVADAPISDTWQTTTGTIVIPNAMIPGQIRMGATWNRYGNPDSTIGEDWPRALAHEIGHYALFLLDNYLGLEDGSEMGDSTQYLIFTDCQGSAMTDAYRQDYSEFLDRPGATPIGAKSWAGNCANTLAGKKTNRADWETIRRFYDFLDGNNIDIAGEGPSALPLEVTKVTYMSVTATDNALVTPLIYLLDTKGEAFALQSGAAQAYLFKTQGTSDRADDVVIPMGTPNGPLIKARGAAPRDRFCVFLNKQRDALLGCIDDMQQDRDNLKLEPVTGWQPQIEVRPVNSTTLGITVTQSGIDGKLYVQILPGYQPTTTVTAPVAEMAPSGKGDDKYIQTLQFPMTIFSGHVRVWVEGTGPHKEAIAPFFLSLGWNGNQFAAFDGNQFVAFDGNQFAAFDGNQFHAFDSNMHSWSAPTSSADGQVSIFNVDNILRGNVASILQALVVPPQIPSWLAPVGQAYRFETAEPLPDDSNLTIQIQYLQRELPDVNEDQLRIYYSPDNGTTWQRQEATKIDTVRNFTAAKMPGVGIYALMATIATPELYQGWEEFAYPDTDSRPVPAALASMDMAYTSVYWHDRAENRWSLYDRTVLPDFSGLVNDLTSMTPLEVYWIYVLTDTVPYIGVPSSTEVRAADTALLPPATFYGWVQPTDTFVPKAGDPVIARINNVVCGLGEVSEYDPVLHGRAAEQPESSAPIVATFPHNLYLPLITKAPPSRYVYKIQIRADSGDSCGANGRKITFQVGDTILPTTYPWNNGQASYSPLGRTD